MYFLDKRRSLNFFLNLIMHIFIKIASILAIIFSIFYIQLVFKIFSI